MLGGGSARGKFLPLAVNVNGMGSRCLVDANKGSSCVQYSWVRKRDPKNLKVISKARMGNEDRDWSHSGPMEADENKVTPEMPAICHTPESYRPGSLALI